MQTLKLPVVDQSKPLLRLLSERTSVRIFEAKSLSDQQISHLLWACQGVNQFNRRTSPSAGALYPLEIYLIDEQHVARYDPGEHKLRIMAQGDMRSKLARAAMDQEFIAQAPVTFVMTAVYQRVAVKYGKQRATRYVDMEAGHAAQNLLLTATAENLGAVPVGAFEDAKVSSLLGLPPDHAPLYLIPVGYPDRADNQRVGRSKY